MLFRPAERKDRRIIVSSLAMNRIVLVLISSIILLGGMLWLLSGNDSRVELGRPSNNESPILLYCAASNRAVVEAVAAKYKAEFGRSVHVQYGASQTLLSSLQVSGVGDLYLPADDEYIELGRKAELVDEVIPVAKMKAVLAVAKGNPKKLIKLDDLLRKDVRFVQVNPDAAAIGRISRNRLQESGWWDKLQKASIGDRTTVTDVANDVVIGAADVGIVYDVVVHSFPQLEAVEVPELESAVSDVAVGVLRSTKNSQAALHFARYLAAKDRGLKHFAENGYDVVEGDIWEDVPSLAIYAARC